MSPPGRFRFVHFVVARVDLDLHAEVSVLTIHARCLPNAGSNESAFATSVFA